MIIRVHILHILETIEYDIDTVKKIKNMKIDCEHLHNP